ncbi:MAG: c-type cytochrome [Gammaproteobacteria bacterium]|nr:c-type cytochrome [Gammaproteobacteria bacterium]
MSDTKFAKTLKIVLGVLVGSTVAILALANVLISDADYSHETVIKENIEDRIRPVGSLHLADSEFETAEETEGETGKSEPELVVADAGKPVEQIYQACAVCHGTGVLNAPKLGDKASWEPRIAKGVEQLYTSAIKGIGTMPPKGGRLDFSDEEVRRAVDYMLDSVR